MDIDQIAESFVKHYYTIFDQGKASIAQLGSLYKDSSMLSFEDHKVTGAQAIVQKLIEMPFQKVSHRITSISSQPSGVPNALLVAVNGDLSVDDEKQPVKFNQVWHLLQEPDGSFWIHNDIFRLNWG